MSNTIDNLINDENFVSKLEKAQTEDEIIALFKANGVEITVDELKAMMHNDEKEELDEESLDEVSGGYIIPMLGYKFLKSIASRGGKGAFGGGGGGSR